MSDDEIAMPCYQTLVAATVALMTRHAAPEPTARVDLATQRLLIARKVVSNLFFLQQHPALSPGLRAIMGHAHVAWAALAAATPGESTPTSGTARLH